MVLRLLIAVMLLTSSVALAQDSPDEAGPLYLTRNDVMRLALSNSPGLRADAYLALSGAQDVRAAEGVRDLVFFAKTLFSDAERPSTSSLSGNNTELWTANVGLRQVLKTGTVYELSWNSARTETDFPFSVLDPNYRVDGKLAVTQPLLKGFGLEVNGLREEIAGHSARALRLTYDGRAMTTAAASLEAFWDLVLARSLHDVRARNLRRAESLGATVRAQIREGLLAELESLKADVAAATRQDEVLLALKTVRDAEDRLRDLLAPDDDPTFWDRELVAVQDTETMLAERELDVIAGLERALSIRPEVLQAREDVAAKAKAMRLARNEMLPSLNLVGSLQLEGLAGTNRRRVNEGSSEFDDFLDDLIDQSPALGEALESILGLFDTNQNVDRDLIGGYSEAVSNLDFFTWSIGVNFEMPLFNDTAEARYVKSVYEHKRSELLSRSLERKVKLEVREAGRRIETGRARLRTTALARKLAEKNLAAETKKLERGYATSQDVLDTQTTLADSRSQELRAQADLEKAWIRYARATGGLMDDLGLVSPKLPDDEIEYPWPF